MISFSSSLRLNVMKYNPYVNKTPNKQTWHISIKNKMEQGKSEMLLLLNTLFYTHNELDGTFTFRRSCKEGSCAAINIDGVNTLSLSCLYRINYEELDKKVKQLIQ